MDLVNLTTDLKWPQQWGDLDWDDIDVWDFRYYWSVYLATQERIACIYPNNPFGGLSYGFPPRSINKDSNKDDSLYIIRWSSDTVHILLHYFYCDSFLLDLGDYEVPIESFIKIHSIANKFYISREDRNDWLLHMNAILRKMRYFKVGLSVPSNQFVQRVLYSKKTSVFEVDVLEENAQNTDKLSKYYGRFKQSGLDFVKYVKPGEGDWADDTASTFTGLGSWNYYSNGYIKGSQSDTGYSCYAAHHLDVAWLEIRVDPSIKSYWYVYNNTAVERYGSITKQGKEGFYRLDDIKEYHKDKFLCYNNSAYVDAFRQADIRGLDTPPTPTSNNMSLNSSGSITDFIILDIIKFSKIRFKPE